jgi:23S rRNA pseudouridine1911/1915/1917 synthase
LADDRWVVDAASSGVRLDKFLAAPGRLGTRGRARAALERRKVFVNDTETGLKDAARHLSADDHVRVWQDRPGSAKGRAPRAPRSGELEILYEDAALVVVNKPPGLLVVPIQDRRRAGSVEALLVEHLRSKGKRRPLVVHRIDRDTSGLVVFAKGAEAFLHLKSQFERREPERVYVAVVYGRPSPPAGTWRDQVVWDRRTLIQKEAHPRDPLGKTATSQYRVLEQFRDAALIEVRLVTGRRNQIRLQARLRGHPLVGERLYVQDRNAGAIAFPRQALHAYRLVITHPLSGLPLRVEAPIPADIGDLIDRLRIDYSTT